MSVLTEKQEKQFRKDLVIGCDPVTIIVKVRYDDRFRNGNNTFSIVADVYEGCIRRGEATVTHSKGATLWFSSGGLQHDLIQEHFPELAHLLKWHLCSSDGPLHYEANTIYQAGGRDHDGLLKGEVRQIRNEKTGKLAWKRGGIPVEYTYGDVPPNDEPIVVQWEPLCQVGKGKIRQFEFARCSAIWPEATDEELSQEPEVLREALRARLPYLLEEFRRDIEALGFTF